MNLNGHPYLLSLCLTYFSLQSISRMARFFLVNLFGNALEVFFCIFRVLSFRVLSGVWSNATLTSITLLSSDLTKTQL